MINYAEFVEKWQRMPHGRSNVYLSINVSHPLNLQIGYYINGQKSLVIMDVGIIKNIPSSYSIKASNPKLKNGSYILEFQLIHNSLEETFLRLCWDMIDSSAQASDPLSALINRYLSWQRLLKQVNKKILSYESQKGLLGELLYLENIAKTIGIQAAIRSWVGPDGSDQDFVFEDSWTEVKTVAASSETIRISSLEQLNHSQTGTLMVYMLEKTTPGINRESLNAKVDYFRNILIDDQISKDHFELKLFKYGYRNEERNAYDSNQFRLIKSMAYEVNENFPKIISDNIPSEIVACSYQISIAAIEPYRRQNHGVEGI